MTKFRYTSLLLIPSLLLALSACSSNQIETLQFDEVEISEEQVEERAIEIPERPLDEATMALVLEAEFALYRNDLERALEIYEQLTAKTEDPGIARRSAEISMSISDPFRTLDAALYYLDLAPEDDYAIELAVRALARSAEVEGAWALLSEYPEKTYELRMATAEAIRLAEQMEDNYQIEWLLEKILETYGTETTDVDVQLSLGLLYEHFNNYEQAAFFAEKANKARPDNLLALRLQVRALLRAERPQEASALLSEWIVNNDSDPDNRIQLVHTLLSFDPETALPILEILSAEYPWSTHLLMTTAQQFLISDTPEKSIPYYQKLSQSGDYRPLAFFNLGRVYETLDDLPLAFENYALVIGNESAGADPELVFEANLRSGRISYQLGDDGSQFFEKIRIENPDQSEALFYEEARVLMNEVSELAAIDTLTEGIDSHPDSESLLYMRSLAYERSDSVDEAIEDLRAILSFDPDNSTVLNALGYTLANRTDQYVEAYELIDRALSMEPEDPAIIDSMGWVLYHMGHYERALGYLRQAYEAFLDEEVISHLVEVLWKMDRIDEAKEILEKGMMDLPDSEMLPETRDRLGLDS